MLFLLFTSLLFSVHDIDLIYNQREKQKHIVFKDDEVGIKVEEEDGIKAVLVLFFDHTNTIQKRSMVYSNVLWEKYKDKGLFVLWIPANPHGMDSLKSKADLKVPVFIDEDHQVHRRYGIGTCCGGILVAGKNRKIIFKDNKLIDPDP